MQILFNQRTLLLALLFLITYRTAEAIPLKELLNFRVAKAELLVVDGKYTKALKILSFNLTRKQFHYDSFDLLADIYLKRGEYVKAVKVYFYMIKQLHTDQFLKLQDSKKLPTILAKTKKPADNVLAIYYKLAQTYQKIFKVSSGTKRFKLKLLKRAEKYYQLCRYYKFNYLDATYQISMIRKKLKDYHKSLALLLEAKNILDKNKQQEDAESLKFLLGDILLRVGKNDSAFLFLKDVAYMDGQNSDVKEYAQNYLDALQKKYMGMSISYGGEYSFNVNGLTLEKYRNFDSSFYHKKDSYISVFSTNIFYSNFINKYLSYVITMFFQHNDYPDTINNLDNRYYGFSFDLKYNNLRRSFAKLTWSFFQYDNRFDNQLDGDYVKNQYSHTFTLTYARMLKYGMLKFKFPFQILYHNQVTQYNKTERTFFYIKDSKNSFGIKILYEPYLKSKYWSPLYQVSFKEAEESDDIYGKAVDNSQKISFIFSNKITLQKKSSIFTTFKLTKLIHVEDDSAYNKVDLQCYYARFIKKLKILAKVKSNFYYKIYQDKSKATAWSIGLTFSKSI